MRDPSGPANLVLRKTNRCSYLQGFVEAVLLDFVEQGFVADTEHPRGRFAIPKRAPEDLQNHVALGEPGRLARDLFEREVAGPLGTRSRRRRRDRRLRDRYADWRSHRLRWRRR